jgi:HPt (histidine-containing phosphotransfer) domain-containing protein
MGQDKKNGGKIVIHAEVDLEDLIPGFLENQRRAAEKILNLVESDDYESIQRIGHSMKGSGGSYGFDEITSIGSYLELAAQDQNLTEIGIQTEALFRYLNCVEVVYD